MGDVHRGIRGLAVAPRDEAARAREGLRAAARAAAVCQAIGARRACRARPRGARAGRDRLGSSSRAGRRGGRGDPARGRGARERADGLGVLVQLTRCAPAGRDGSRHARVVVLGERSSRASPEARRTRGRRERVSQVVGTSRGVEEDRVAARRPLRPTFRWTTLRGPPCQWASLRDRFSRGRLCHHCATCACACASKVHVQVRCAASHRLIRTGAGGTTCSATGGRQRCWGQRWRPAARAAKGR